MIIKQRKAAMEMTMGTLVTIVLLVAVLVLGIIFVRSIFKSANEVTDLTDQQLKNEIAKLFAEDERVQMYPSNNQVSVKQGAVSGFAFGIQNILEGTSQATKFSYEIIISDSKVSEKCGGLKPAEIEKWIVTGKEEKDILIASGDVSSQKVLFNIPKGSPLCTFRLRVNVLAGSTAYSTGTMDVTIKK